MLKIKTLLNAIAVYPPEIRFNVVLECLLADDQLKKQLKHLLLICN